MEMFYPKNKSYNIFLTIIFYLTKLMILYYRNILSTLSKPEVLTEWEWNSVGK